MSIFKSAFVLALLAGAAWSAPAPTPTAAHPDSVGRAEFAAKLGRQLDTLGERIVVLKEKAKTRGEKVKQSTRDEIKKLEAAKEKTKDKVDSLAEIGEAKGKVGKARAELEVDSLKAALDRLWKKVKG